MDIPLVPATPMLADRAVSGGVIPVVETSAGASVATPRSFTWGHLLALGCVAAGWGVVAFAATRLQPSLPVHRTALFVHLLSLVVGLGAIVVIDTYGAGCLLSGRSPVAVAQLAGALDPLIWGGLAGLMASGALLHPSLSSGLTWAKLAAVLVAGLNGVNAHGLRTAVAALAPSTSLWQLPRPLLLRLAATAAISQTAWWLAVLIGFWNNN
jgi:hypothetical protein